jgi:DNA ligase-1
MMGTWSPSAKFFRDLIAADGDQHLLSHPYPFALAHPLETALEQLGDPGEWQVEWKWDGIRAQLVRRGGETFVWSRGEELITDRFPEIREIGDHLPDGTVLDGEIVAWRDGAPMPFAELQKRIGRKTVGKKLLADVPVTLIAFDVLEHAGRDLRALPLRDRRSILESVPGEFFLAPVHVGTWEQLAEIRLTARESGTEGFMLKRLDSPYPTGRKRGFWWKWKTEPMTVDAVLVYAQRGSGRRASLYSDYTFAIWDETGNLVPFAKAYSGLDDDEMRRVDAFVRQNTLEKFGPVRTVTPTLVMELAFEGIQLSKRHKSGIAVRFPRIARWRHDKTPDQADTLVAVKRLISSSEPS